MWKRVRGTEPLRNLPKGQSAVFVVWWRGQVRPGHVGISDKLGDRLRWMRAQPGAKWARAAYSVDGDVEARALRLAGRMGLRFPRDRGAVARQVGTRLQLKVLREIRTSQPFNPVSMLERLEREVHESALGQQRQGAIQAPSEVQEVLEKTEGSVGAPTLGEIRGEGVEGRIISLPEEMGEDGVPGRCNGDRSGVLDDMETESGDDKKGPGSPEGLAPTEGGKDTEGVVGNPQVGGAKEMRVFDFTGGVRKRGKR